ncbi:hypothetical protein [Methanolacinia petrolearia]|uniref:hypothetical protein n=1 Tax=Methanolacinia petrolearia TaxID=54120 RepID=UPI003BAD52D3
MKALKLIPALNIKNVKRRVFENPSAQEGIKNDFPGAEKNIRGLKKSEVKRDI